MSQLIELLETYSSKVLRDEDGNRLLMSNAPGVPPERLADFEHRHRIKLPGQSEEIYLEVG